MLEVGVVGDVDEREAQALDSKTVQMISCLIDDVVADASMLCRSRGCGRILGRMNNIYEMCVSLCVFNASSPTASTSHNFNIKMHLFKTGWLGATSQSQSVQNTPRLHSAAHATCLFSRRVILFRAFEARRSATHFRSLARNVIPS